MKTSQELKWSYVGAALLAATYLPMWLGAKFEIMGMPAAVVIMAAGTLAILIWLTLFPSKKD